MALIGPGCLGRFETAEARGFKAEGTTITSVDYSPTSGIITVLANKNAHFRNDIIPLHLTDPERLVIDLPDAALSPFVKQTLVHQNGIDRVEFSQSSGIFYHITRLTVFLSDPKAADNIKLAVLGNQLVLNTQPNGQTAANFPAASVNTAPNNLNMPAPLPSAKPFNFSLAPGMAVIRSITLTAGSLNIQADNGGTLVVKHEFVLRNPSRVVMDLNNAVLADKSLLETLTASDGPIHSVRIGQFDMNTVRLVIETPSPRHLIANSPDQLPNHLSVALGAPIAPTQNSNLPPQVVDTPLDVSTPFTPRTLPIDIAPPAHVPHGMYTVVIDAGHGGKDLGANREGVLEKVLNMQVAMRVQQALEALGVSVVMTHTGDSFVPLPEICNITNRVHPDAFVSIHTNASVNPVADGLETYYLSPQSRALATDVHHRLVSAVNSPDRGIRTARFYVIHHTAIPAILVEMGYISNPRERAELQTDARQQATANAVAAGVVEFLGRNYNAQLP